MSQSEANELQLICTVSIKASDGGRHYRLMRADGVEGDSIVIVLGQSTNVSTLSHKVWEAEGVYILRATVRVENLREI